MRQKEVMNEITLPDELMEILESTTEHEELETIKTVDNIEIDIQELYKQQAITNNILNLIFAIMFIAVTGAILLIISRIVINIFYKNI